MTLGSKALLATCFLLLFIPLHSSLKQYLSGADSLSIGTPFTLTIETDFPVKDIVIPDTLKSFKVTDIKRDLKGSNTKSVLTIVPFELGALSFPKLEVKSSLILRGSEFTDAFRVYVLNTRAEGDTLLRDIKPLERLPWQPPFWGYLLVIFAAMSLVVILLVRHLRSKPSERKPHIIQEAIPAPIAAWKHAISRLDTLEKSDLITSDTLAFHFELSAILREFLESTYGFNAMEMTTSEIHHAYKITRHKYSERVVSILEFCDLVKFAKLIPAYHEIKKYSDELRDYFLLFAPPSKENVPQ